MLGSSEGVYCGIPMVVTPIYGDQYLNGAAIENRKIGKIVAYEEISSENVKAAIEYALQPEIKENADKVSYAFRTRPKTPTETAVWWVEQIAAMKGFPLGESHYKHLSTYVAYSFDIYTLFVIIIFIIIACIYFFIKCIHKRKFTKIKCQ